MAGEIQRSGFSNPESVIQTNQLKPDVPTQFQVTGVGKQSTNAPYELPYISFKWKKVTEFVVNIEDGLNDDVYDSKDSVGTLAGTQSTNDTVIDLTSAPNLSPDDRIQIGTDPTRYVVESVSGTQVTLTYGLLQDQPLPGVDVYKLSGKSPSPDDSRLVTCDADDESTITVYCSYEFENVMKWTIDVELLELEDLDKVGGTLSESNRNYWKRRTGNITQAGQATGSTMINMLGPVQDLSAGDSIYFGDSETEYTIQSVDSTSIELTSALVEDIEDESETWILVTDTFDDYSNLSIDTAYGYKSGNASAYRLYKSTTPLSETNTGDLVETITSYTEDDGWLNYTFNCPEHTYDGTRFYFAITAIDDQVPANESEYSNSAWVVTPPSQAYFTDSNLVGTDLTLTYVKLTDGGANPHLKQSMLDSENQFSKFGGYDIYLVDYTTTSGSYSGQDTDTGSFYSTDLMVGDVVRIVNASIQRVWVTHVVSSGYAVFDNDNLVYGSDVSDYTALTDGDFSVEYLRVTDRDSQSVLPLDGSGNKQYLTDYSDTYTVTIDAGKNQGVLIEAVDTEAGYGL